MNIRVVDFDIVTRKFQPYVDGHKKINEEKKKMIESIQSEKKEMESIISTQSSGLYIDEATQQKNAQRFREIQDSLMKKDAEFKRELKELNDQLNMEIFDQLQVIISDWSKENSIDLVMGKMEVIYNTNEIEITDQILEIIKEKELFYSEEESSVEK
jgi:hypothetical protein